MCLFHLYKFAPYPWPWFFYLYPRPTSVNIINVLPFQAAETSRHPILVNEEPDRSILDPDSGAIIKLYAEGDLICESRCFMDALASLIAAYYVFNIHYPTGLTCTLTFMQKIVLNLQDKEKTPQRVIKALKKLNTWNKENLKQ